MGSIVFAAKTNAQLEFVQEYARMESKLRIRVSHNVRRD